MNEKNKLWLMLTTLVVVAVLAGLLASKFSFPPHLSRLMELRPGHQVRGDIELFYTVKTVISTINITLLIFLLIAYIDIYKKTKSEFTIGLMIFSMTLLLYALFSNPLIYRIFGFRAFGLGPFIMLPDLFTCVALIMLLYLTFKY